MDIQEFMHVIVHIWLRQSPEPYYVKGGRVYDVYFKDKTDSVDWDIVGNTGFKSYLFDKLSEIAKNQNLTLLQNEIDFDGTPMTQYGFKDIYAEKGDPYLIDLLIVDQKDLTDYTMIEGVKYMTLQNFVIDLLLTQDQRADKTNRISKYFSKELIFEYMDTYNIPHDINITSIQKAIQESLPYVRKQAEQEDIRDLLLVVDGLESLDIPKDPDALIEARSFSKDLRSLVDVIENQNTDDDDDWQEIDFFDDYDSFVDQVANYLVSLEVGEPTLRKYKKTRKRYNNVIDLSWTNLSDQYKVYLLEHCDSHPNSEIQLFDISDTCKAYVQCNLPPKIIKETDCLSHVQKEKLKKVDVKLS